MPAALDPGSHPADAPPRAAPVHIRPLRAADRERLAEHLLRLDPASRRLRFGGVANEAFIRAYAGRALDGAGLLLGLFRYGYLRGVAELHPLDDTGTSGELAVSLEVDLQGAGHGTRLVSSLVGRARRAGIGRIVLQCLSENHAMLRLARRAGARIRFEGGEVEAVLRIEREAAPAPRSGPGLRAAARRGVEAVLRDAEAGAPALG